VELWCIATQNAPAPYLFAGALARMLSRMVPRLSRDRTYSPKSDLRLGRKSSPAKCCAQRYGWPSEVAASVSPNDSLLQGPRGGKRSYQNRAVPPMPIYTATSEGTDKESNRGQQ
jgi:hypothetical protein